MSVHLHITLQILVSLLDSAAVKIHTYSACMLRKKYTDIIHKETEIF